MRDYLDDIIHHTCNLGNIDLIKIVGDDKETLIKAISEDRFVIMNAKLKQPNSEFVGVFGMPNLPKLKTILGFEEYDETSTIVMTYQQQDNEKIPASIHFETANKDFVNDYRLMGKTLVEDKVRDVKFHGATWVVQFEPKVASVVRLKKQYQANSEETLFTVKTDNGNLKFYFGNLSTHSGNFIFESGISGTLQHNWQWPIRSFLSIMDLQGDKKVYISDAGAMRITVDSGLTDYEYLLPAQTK
jgi:hypothetical protein